MRNMKNFGKIRAMCFCRNNNLTCVSYWNCGSITDNDFICSDVKILVMKVIKLIGEMVCSS